MRLTMLIKRKENFRRIRLLNSHKSKFRQNLSASTFIPTFRPNVCMGLCKKLLLCFIKRHTMKTSGRAEVQLQGFQTSNLMEVSGQFHLQMGESLASLNAKAKKESGQGSNSDWPGSLVTVLVGLASTILRLRRTAK